MSECGFDSITDEEFESGYFSFVPDRRLWDDSVSEFDNYFETELMDNDFWSV